MTSSLEHNTGLDCSISDKVTIMCLGKKHVILRNKGTGVTLKRKIKLVLVFDAVCSPTSVNITLAIGSNSFFFSFGLNNNILQSTQQIGVVPFQGRKIKIIIEFSINPPCLNLTVSYYV